MCVLSSLTLCSMAETGTVNNLTKGKISNTLKFAHAQLQNDRHAREAAGSSNQMA